MSKPVALGRRSKRATDTREASDFDLARLRNALVVPRDSGTIIPSWSLKEIFEARDAQMRGYFALAARAADSMRTDDALYVAYCNRLDPQRCVRVQMKPSSDKAKAISVADEAEALFGRDGVGIAPGTFTDINGCLVNHGVAFGINVMNTREDGSRVDIEHRFWPIEFVRWDDVRKQYIARVDPASISPGDLVSDNLNPEFGPLMLGAAEVPITHGDGRWVIYANHEDRPFKQEAAILPALAVWARHAFAARDWTKGSTAHGNAKFIGELPEGVPLQNADGSLTAEAMAMLILLQDLANGESPVGIRPAGAKSDFLTNTSTAWQVWSELVANGERAAARIYLGTDGTLGTTGGAPGVDISALFGVAVTKVRGDLGCIERCFRSGTLEPWAALNFGDSTLAPTRKYMLPDADEDAERAEVGTRRTAFYADIKAIKDHGFELTQDVVDDLAKQYGVSTLQLPEPPETPTPVIELDPADLAKVVTVNEARTSEGLPPLMLPDGVTPDPVGSMTIEGYTAKMTAEAKAEPKAASNPAAPAVPAEPAAA